MGSLLTTLKVSLAALCGADAIAAKRQLPCGTMAAVSATFLPRPPRGYARCVRCLHIFLIHMLRVDGSWLACPWCLENRTGTPHGKVNPASCDCRLLAG